MKHILILENQTWDRAHPVHHILEDLVKENGCTYEILEHVGRIEPSQIIASLAKCDTILFVTTWLYEDSIHSLGKLLSHPNVESKVIYYFGDENVAHHLEKIFTLEELKNLSKHKFNVIKHWKIENEEDWCEEFDLKQYDRKWQEQERIRIEKNKSFSGTGRKVRIKKIVASGKQWSNLKEGDIVEELDCSSIDPNPARGIWVMGLDEPVKLLNSDGYEEWEYAELKAMNLAIEFFSRGNKKDQTSLIELFADWIRNCSGKLKLSNAELWIQCDDICNTVGVERRGNRSYFERRLQEYREQYVYFKEDCKRHSFKG